MTESTVVPWQIYSVTISNDSSHRLELGRLLEWEVQMETLAAKVSRVCLATDAAECDTILAEIIKRHDMKEEKYPSISVPSKLPSFQKCTLPLASSTAPVTARYGSIVPNQHYKFSLPYPDKPQYRDTFTVTVSFQLRSAKGTWEVFQQLLQLEKLLRINDRLPKCVFQRSPFREIHLKALPPATDAQEVSEAKTDEDAEFDRMREADAEAHKQMEAKEGGCVIA